VEPTKRTGLGSANIEPASCCHLVAQAPEAYTHRRRASPVRGLTELRSGPLGWSIRLTSTFRRRWVATCGEALVLALSAAFGAFATPAQAQTAPQDSAVGHVSFFFGLATADFDARSGPPGENPRDSVGARSHNGLVVGGPVTCLTVTGNDDRV
jgi:hypothetical protein